MQKTWEIKCSETIVSHKMPLGRNSALMQVSRLMPGSDYDELRSYVRVPLVGTSSARRLYFRGLLSHYCEFDEFLAATGLFAAKPIAAQNIMNINHIKISRVYQFHPAR